MNTQQLPASWINDGKTVSAQVDPAHPSYIAPICFLDDEWSPEIVAANARLIAAAPDLLAELQKAELALRYAAQESAGKVRKEIVGGWLYHANKAKAAIAKATGAA